MIKNKRGAALMQVLLITMILAGMATMLLRASLSRTSSARKTRRVVTAEMLIESCMAEVNALWASKNDEAFLNDLSTTGSHSSPIMYVDKEEQQPQSEYVCHIADPDSGDDYTVTASFVFDMDTHTWLVKYVANGIE